MGVAKFSFFFQFQIEGFDDDAGRVVVKMAIGGMKASLNVFLMQAVSKKEYAEYGKVLSKLQVKSGRGLL